MKTAPEDVVDVDFGAEDVVDDGVVVGLLLVVLVVVFPFGLNNPPLAAGFDEEVGFCDVVLVPIADDLGVKRPRSASACESPFLSPSTAAEATPARHITLKTRMMIEVNRRWSA